MPHLDGLNALAELKNRKTEAKVVFVTMHHDSAFAQMVLNAGAMGFVLKHCAADDLVPAVRAALNGETYSSASLRSD
jgi:DNA-binding NarL/FixJ family response regulator